VRSSEEGFSPDASAQGSSSSTLTADMKRMAQMAAQSAGRPVAEVEKEIQERLAANIKATPRF
jgi:hypothetical protein